MDGCYYGDAEVCEGELWECQTCRERFCQTHWHQTAKGRNIECCACEHTAGDYERDFGNRHPADGLGEVFTMDEFNQSIKQ